MTGYINPPKKMPFFFRLVIRMIEKKMKKPLDAARILTWYPKAAIGAGVMEGLVAHDEGAVTERLLKLVRMQVSFRASCPFCIDMNSFQFDTLKITEEEIRALQGTIDMDAVATFSEKEKTALQYAIGLTDTPIHIDQEILSDMLRYFSEKDFVIIVSTIAQVNFWTRLIQGVGIRPAGFTEKCAVLNLEKYTTLKKSEK